MTPLTSIQRTRHALAVLACALLFLVAFVERAMAYQISYYLGSPSTPVFVIGVGGVFGGTCCTAFRLFNEATATNAAGPMSFVQLLYNGSAIGAATNTRYYVVYRNGPSSVAQCLISSPPQGTYAYCDTTY